MENRRSHNDVSDTTKKWKVISEKNAHRKIITEEKPIVNETASFHEAGTTVDLSGATEVFGGRRPQSSAAHRNPYSILSPAKTSANIPDRVSRRKRYQSDDVDYTDCGEFAGRVNYDDRGRDWGDLGGGKGSLHAPRIGPQYQANVEDFPPSSSSSFLSSTSSSCFFSTDTAFSRKDPVDISDDKIWSPHKIRESHLIEYLHAANDCVENLKAEYLQKKSSSALQLVVHSAVEDAAYEVLHQWLVNYPAAFP